MIAALLMMWLCADPVAETLPDNFRAYFKRVDDLRSNAVHGLEDQITDRNIDLRSAPTLRTQNILKREIARLEKQLIEAKKQKAFAFIPNPLAAKPGDLGLLRPGEVSRSIDDKTAIVIVKVETETTTSGVFSYVITAIDSKPLKAGLLYRSSDLWRVVSTKTTDEALLRQLPGEYLIVAPVPKEDVARFEAMYLAAPKALGVKRPAKPE